MSISKHNSPRVSPPRRRSRSTTPEAEGDDGAAAATVGAAWVYKPSLTLADVAMSASASAPSESSGGQLVQPPPRAVTLPRPVTTTLLPTYKILLIGDAAVGKSNLLSRFANNTFDIASRSTIGVEFVSREVELPTPEKVGGTEKVNIQLWDTAGQERGGLISSAFFRGAKGVAVVYDMTRQQTLKSVPGWVGHAKRFADANCAFVVIGNKSDLHNLQAVSHEDAESVAHSLDVRHFTASALTGEGVPAAFLHLILSVNALMRTQAIAGPIVESQQSRNASRKGPMKVDVAGFGSTAPSSRGPACCNK